MSRLPGRRADSHKGDFGRVLVIGGARGMSGATMLSGAAALRSGAGLVQVATPASSQPIVAGYEPSYMTIALPEDEAGRIAPAADDLLQTALAAATVVAIGPGLGRSADTTALVTRLYRQSAQPLVCDADALNALCEQPEVLDQAAGERVLTPHPGEFRRLATAVGQPLPERADATTRAEYEAAAIALAARWRCVVVLKGHRSLITDGTLQSHNSTGNPGMARGGSGDVLTGIVAALLAQGLAPFAAAQLAAEAHGRAGDLAAAELGVLGMIASDLVKFLPAALRELS